MMQQEEDTMIDESESNQESRQDEGSAVIDAMMEESSTQGEIETTTELSS